MKFKSHMTKKEKMTNGKAEIWFTSRSIHDKDSNESSWKQEVKWPRLNQFDELVSLDGVLNNLTFEPDFETEIKEIVSVENQVTQFFKSIDYVKRKSNHLDYYNLLAIIREPQKSKQSQLERDFDFIGYDLIEADGNASALTNDHVFNEIVKPKEQNKYGLISTYERAKEIQIELSKNNKGAHHADYYLFEVWRHKFIGRNGSFNEEFCIMLEYHLGTTFFKSDRDELKGFWCDGVLEKRISKKQVNDTRIIATIAWIGKNGQGEYDMRIYFGNKSLRRFAKGTSMIDCIPNSDSMDWIKMDIEKRIIEIELN